MLPIRFVAESLHMDVEWLPQTREIVITNQIPSAQDYAGFTLETQAIDVTTISNVRQLGDYPCKDGRKVRDGALLSGGVLSWLSDEDNNTLLGRYNLKYVVDFRSEAERKDTPDMEIPDAEYIYIPVYGGDLFTEKTAKKLSEIEPEDGDSLARALAYAENGIITERYERILLSKTAQNAYSRFFDVLLNAGGDEAVLWHCSAGKGTEQVSPPRCCSRWAPTGA